MQLHGAILAIVLIPVCCRAQNEHSPHFEVAAVKPATGIGIFTGGLGSEHVSWGGTTLETLINSAYNLRPGQISGPDWLRTEYYSVSAKLPINTTMEQFCQMETNLLAERFGLVVHRVTKEVPGFELNVAGTVINLTPSDPEATAPITSARTRAAPMGERPMPDASGFPALSSGQPWASLISGGIMRMTFRRCTMAFLADRLRAVLSQSGPGVTVPVSDQTALSGRYDFHLEIPQPAPWTPATIETRFGTATVIGGDPDVGPRDISAAMEKQLGLKLTAVKTKLDTIVVDKVNRIPSEN